MVCDTCGEDAVQYTRKPSRGGMRTVCRCCLTGKVRPSVYNPFSDLVLDHVRDAQDRPVTVTSLRQLRQVEKDHRCLSAVANLDDAHVNEPPQHKPGSAFKSMTDEGRWLHPEIAIPMYEEMKRNGEVF